MNQKQLIIFFLIVGVIGDAEQCYNDWQMMYASTQTGDYTSDYFKMLQYSGFTINDLGNYNGCNEISIARYVVFEINDSPRIVQTACGPISCSKEDYYNTSMPYYTSTDNEVIFPHKYQTEVYSEYSGSTITMLILGSILAGLVLIATALDLIYKSEYGHEDYFKLLRCFSFKKNFKYVISARHHNRDGTEETLNSFDCVRVLAIGWLIVGQTLVSYNEFLPLINYANLIHETTETSFMLSYGGFFSADIFFWMSGILITYFFLERYSDREISALDIGKEFASRLLRIFPAYFFIVLFMWAMTAHIGNGPMWYYVNDRLNGDCDDYWYTNMFFINNFIPHGKASYCHSDSWFITCLMQYFLLSIFILTLYVKVSKMMVWSILSTFVIVGISTTAIIANHYELIITQETYNEEYIRNYLNYFYGKPYLRIGPYAIGVACGIILYTCRVQKSTGRVTDLVGSLIGGIWENKYVRYIGAAVSFVINVVLIVLVFKSYRYLRNDDTYSDSMEQAYYIYIGLRRPVFTICISFILMPALLGHFDEFRWFLSHHVWSILSKFVYGMFLIYFPIMQIAQLSAKDSIELNIYNVLKDAVYFFILAFLFSIPIVFLLELPSRNIKDLYFPRYKKTHHKKRKDKTPLMSDQE